MKELSMNFYDCVLRSRDRATRMGESHTFHSLPDKKSRFVDVKGSLEKLQAEGYDIQIKRMDSSSEHGFFGNFVTISCVPVLED